MNTIGKDETRRRLQGRHISAHTHEYGQHPNWPTHVACVICGLSITKNLLPQALKAGAKVLFPIG